MATVEEKQIEDKFGLSPLQQGMLFHTLREKGIGMYISQAVSRYENLDCEAFHRAWQLMVDRHQVLRTSFNWEDPENPCQIVHRRVVVPFRKEDWRGQSPSEQNTRLRKLQQKEMEQGFDLSRPTQLRIAVIRITRNRWFCVQSHHHIILDGWSGALLANELKTAYAAFRRGITPSLYPPIPFGSYIRWIESQDREDARQFWKDQLSSAIRPTPMPADREIGPRARVRMHVESWDVKLDDVAADRVASFARRCRVTLNTVIQAAWPVLLSRHSGQKSVLFGVVVSGRPPELPGVESIVGMFLNTIPFCVAIEDTLPVGEWLQRIHTQRAQLQNYEYVSLMTLQQLSRLPGGIPLFESIVARKDVTQASDPPRRTGANQRKRGGTKPEQATFQQNYPILLNITASQGIKLKITYDARRFRAIDISRILEQLKQIIINLSMDPDQKPGDVRLASEEELHRLRYGWNDTRMEIGETPPLDELIARHAGTETNRIAAEYNGQTISFRELNRRVAHAAGCLIKRGVRRDIVVAVALGHPLHQISAVMAVMRAGARCLPLERAYGDPAGTLQQVTACQTVITDVENPKCVAGTRSIIHPADLGLEGMDSVDTEPDEAFAMNRIPRQEDSGLILPRKMGGLQAVEDRFLGSRFTGQVLISAPDTRLGIWHPWDSFEFFSQLYACWQARGTVCFLPHPAETDLGHLCQAIASSGGTRLSVTPSILAGLLKHPEQAVQAQRVQTWICSGEPMWPELADAFNDQFPQSRLVNVFSSCGLGPCLAWEVPQKSLDGEGIRLGFPLPNIQAYLSSDAFHLAPVGVVGELFIAFDGTAGYPDPEGLLCDHTLDLCGSSRRSESADFGDGLDTLPKSTPLFSTGVLARRWNDGAIEYLGRVDQERGLDPVGLAAVSRARRNIWKTAMVEMSEVLHSGPKTRLACIGTSYRELDLSALHKQLCRQVTAAFAPTHYLILSTWPLDRFGRTDRSKLLAVTDQAVDASGFVQVIKKPKSEIEKIIAEVWMEVLRIDKISTDDNFFELGGHSLAATKATARLTRILRSDIQLKGIFEAPTVSALAEWIQSDRHKEELPFAIEAADRGKDAPLTFTQQQLWVLGQLFPQLPTYTIPSNAIFSGKLDLEALEKAIKDIVDRHEILRTVFVFHNGEPRQVARPKLEKLQLDLVDVAHLPEEERMEKARWHGAQLSKIPWDFENGPLIRFQLVKLDESEYLLNTAFHHIIADGPSMGVYLADLGAFYSARCRGRAPELPPLPLQFADFAVWERENIKGNLFERQLAYWRQKLDGAALLEIPTDFPRPPVHGFFGKKVKFEIPSETGTVLYRLGREQGATMFMCLVAVYQLLLFKYSGQDDIVIGSAMTNRIRVELEKLIGLFVNTVPLRTDFSGDPTFREILDRVRDCCLGAYANMDLPFEETIAQLQPHRDLSRQGSPLFQFMLIHNPGGRTLKAGAKSNGPAFRPGEPHNDTGHANFDLLLSTRDTKDSLIKVTMAYDTELFRPETIDRMIVHLQNLVQEATRKPDVPISRLDMSGEEERKEILTVWNGQDIEPESRTEHQIVADNARRFPDHPAVCYKTRCLSYDELDRRSNRMKALLRKAGVKAGGAFVPIDAGLPPERIRHILDETRCTLLVSNSQLAPVIMRQKADLTLADITSPDIYRLDSDVAEVQVSLTDLSYVIFTSGSTGLPKGVMVEHHSLTNIIQSQVRMFEITRESRVLQMLSISFDAAVGEIFRTLVAGGTLFMADPDELLPGPGLVRLLEENRITAVAMSPTALGAMPDCNGILTELRTITVGGEACPQRVAER